MSTAPQTLDKPSSLKSEPLPIKKRSYKPIIWLGVILASGALFTGVAFAVQHALSSRTTQPNGPFAVSSAAPITNDPNPTDRSWFYGHDGCLTTGCGESPQRSTPASSAPRSTAPPAQQNPYRSEDNGSGGTDIGNILANPNAIVQSGPPANPMDVSYDDEETTSESSQSYSGATPGPVAVAPPTVAPVEATSPAPSTQWRANSRLENPAGMYVLQAISMLPATIDVAINSDKPGNPVALISRDVYDSVRLHYLLIPKGTRVYGEYHEATVYGQNRLAIVWTRLVFPEGGKTYTLPSFSSADAQGASGVNAHVDKHTGNIIGNGALLTLFGVVPALASGGQVAVVNTNGNIGVAALQANTQTIAALQNALIGPALAQPPTLSIQVGEPIQIVVLKDLTFPSPFPFEAMSEAP